MTTVRKLSRRRHDSSPRRGEEWPALFFFLSIVAGILATRINSVVFCWIFLPRIYDKPFDKWSFVSADMLFAYWDWTPGKVMCVVNAVLFAAPALWLWIGRAK